MNSYREIQVTQVSGEELLERFDGLEDQLRLLQNQIESQGDAKPNLLTTKKVCAHLNIGHSTLHKYVKNGIISKYGLPGSGKSLYKLDEIEGLMIKYKP